MQRRWFSAKIDAVKPCGLTIDDSTEFHIELGVKAEGKKPKITLVVSTKNILVEYDFRVRLVRKLGIDIKEIIKETTLAVVYDELKHQIIYEIKFGSCLYRLLPQPILECYTITQPTQERRMAQAGD